MMYEDLLERLAASCGVEPDYYDIWGNVHKVSHETRKALLSAMRVPVEDEASVERALNEQELRPWLRGLDPVLVVRETASSIGIPLRVPEVDINSPFEWTLSEENGSLHHGQIVPAELERTGRRDVDGQAFVQYLLILPVRPPSGYHLVEVRQTEGAPGFSASLRLIVTPEVCYTPAGLSGEGRVWGPAVQLYALRSRRNWGIGDFTDLERLVDWCADVGAGIVGVNPLHGLFPENPSHTSPYSPSSRRFLNYLYLDVEAIADFPECREALDAVRAPSFQARLVVLREDEFVDYEEVAAAKRPVLEMLWRHFQDYHLSVGSERADAFRRFQAEGGEDLSRYALFEALQEHFHRQAKSMWGWPVWPEEYRDPRSEAVAGFSAAHRDRVEFFQYVQWQACLQLTRVGRRSMDGGLRVGLYQDLPVSVDSAGVSTWESQELYALGARVGAPPDDFNLRGQDWGLPPFIPERLFESAYAPYIALLRQNMRDGGAIRIDHVMGLMRLFWVPPGKTPVEGAYVHYPFGDLLGILALESQRNRCLVIGEDLGTVPDAVREALALFGVFSYKVSYFEKDSEGSFKAPGDYPEQALVAVSTHDLPTLSGYWKARDITTRTELGLFPTEALRESQIIARAEDRARLLLALDREGLFLGGVDADPASVPEITQEIAAAVHFYYARTPSKIFMIQFEDILGQIDQVNLPGTVDEYPNWRRKLPLDLESFWEDPRIEAVAEGLRGERGSGAGTAAGASAEGAVLSRSGVPTATYRIQLSKDFTFRQTADLVPYLNELGVSHCYLSPFLKARPGSLHGYDIVDHNELNPEIGSREDFEILVEVLHRNGMGQILDMVPNHMGVGSDNVWWMDVLENGQSSDYAEFFDINWRPVKDELRGKVLLPILEDHYGGVLERGLMQLALDPENGEFTIGYRERRFPVEPGTYPRIMAYDIERLEARILCDDPCLHEFQSLVAAFKNLPGCRETAAERVKARRRDKEVFKRHLARLCAERTEVDRFLAENVAVFNGELGKPASFDLMHGLLESQVYRLANWRVAKDEINYRRFFDINDLAGLCIERARVFETTHRFVLELVAQGKIDGLRVDHLDGLYDPAQYCLRLQEKVAGRELSQMGTEQQGLEQTPVSGPEKPMYVVVEKILSGNERLPDNWSVYGTTGYEFANLANGLLVDASAEQEMTRIYNRFVGERHSHDALVYECKRLIMKDALSSELNVLTSDLNRISESDRHTRDFTLQSLREALAQVVAFFPVYRTYVTSEQVSREDRSCVERAVAKAKARSRAEDASIYDFLHDVLVLDAAEGKDDAYQAAVTHFAMKFQQYTGPVMAKGVEDTFFYIYNRLLSLNDVGADPRRFSVSLSEFHKANGERFERWPHTMVNTSTHDSKRSEDVRARVSVLSEMPGEWRKRVVRWGVLNRSRKQKIDGILAPSRNDEYAIYQALLGVWPLEAPDTEGLFSLRERVEQAIIKGVREAKIHSSWINPDSAYEDAVKAFVAGILDGVRANRFLEDFIPFQNKVAWFAMWNSLSMLLLKLTSPGVPDIYQGNEIWRFSLVDPDNRRPVDFARCRDMLALVKEFLDTSSEVLPERVRTLMETAADGRIKLYITWKTLDFRRKRTDLFQDGDYVPLVVSGPKAEHLCAFARHAGNVWTVVVAPRLFARLLEAAEGSFPVGQAVWKDTRVEMPSGSEGDYLNILTGEGLSLGYGEDTAVAAAALLASFPVGLLVRL
jgi:(1->4)-alpha-D-glucan 1-alpha-D-glucosylmutase